jgi:four helix bundle protein
MATYNHFYELPIYKKCRAFKQKISVIVKTHFPKEEKFLLSAQTLDAVRSITANIAEGFERYHYQENIQFCRQSRGSLAEVMEHIITAYDQNIFLEKF